MTRLYCHQSTHDTCKATPKESSSWNANRTRNVGKQEGCILLRTWQSRNFPTLRKRGPISVSRKEPRSLASRFPYNKSGEFFPKLLRALFYFFLLGLKILEGSTPFLIPDAYWRACERMSTWSACVVWKNKKSVSNVINSESVSKIFNSTRLISWNDWKFIPLIIDFIKILRINYLKNMITLYYLIQFNVLYLYYHF